MRVSLSQHCTTAPGTRPVFGGSMFPQKRCALEVTSRFACEHLHVRGGNRHGV